MWGIVTINDRFRLRLDEQTKILETKKGAAWEITGYYIHLEHALKRVAQIEADNGFETVTIKEYIRQVLRENEKIHALFEGLVGQMR
jgi:serine/threonine protein kinase HipA of HipAB toxin-antitoxin module